MLNVIDKNNTIMDFTGFSIYRKYTDGGILLIHIIKGNTFSDYRLAVEMVYKSWEANVPLTEDVILCSIPDRYDGYSITNPIFSAKDIDTEHEFDRDNFQYKHYGI